MGVVEERLREKLSLAFSPEKLSITDDSEKHRGHAGHREGGETHFTVEIVSEAFAGKGRVERQRMVNKVLADELAGQVHALSIKAEAP